jgi:tetratricopeptide (TPR) repeat protein
VKARADQLAAAGQWSAAGWYVERQLAERPADASLYVERARLRGRQGDVAGRTDDLVKAVGLGAGSAAVAALAAVRGAEGEWGEAARLLALAAERGRRQRAVHALACLKAGDHDGYRRVCEAGLSSVSKDRAGFEEANEAAWACALAPGATADYVRAVELAEHAVAVSPSEARPGYLNTLGAVLYRAGRHREAVVQLREAVRLNGSSPGGTAEDWIFLALAYHALGEVEEASRWLEKVRSAPQPGGAFSWARVEYEFLRGQLEEVLTAPGRD